MLQLNDPKDVGLTEKEKMILRLTYNDETTKRIASYVGLSPRTVEAIRNTLKDKTGAEGFAGLTVFAQRANLTDFPTIEEVGLVFHKYATVLLS